MHQFLDEIDNFEFLDLNLLYKRFWGWNFKHLSLDLESAYLRYHVHQFSDNANNYEFFGTNLAKNGFWGRNNKNLALDVESVSLRNYVHWTPTSRENQELWIFGSKFAPKAIVVSGFQKCKSRFGISILEILGAEISRQKGQFFNFWSQICLKIDFGVGIWKI